MKTVTDSYGVKWFVVFNFMRAAVIKDCIGVDLFDQGEKDADGNVIRKSMGERLQAGEFSALDIAWFLNCVQAKRMKLDKYEFGLRFEDVEILNASAEEFTDFCQSVIKKQQEAQGAALSIGGVGTISGDSQPSPTSPTLVVSAFENCASEQKQWRQQLGVEPRG